jgi:hypothetical protein
VHAVVELCWRVSQHAHLAAFAFLSTASPPPRRLLLASSPPPPRRLLAASPPHAHAGRDCECSCCPRPNSEFPIFYVQDVHNYMFVRVMIVLSRVHSCVSRLCVFLHHDFELYINYHHVVSRVCNESRRSTMNHGVHAPPSPDSRNQVQPVSNSARHRMRKQGERGGVELRLALSYSLTGLGNSWDAAEAEKCAYEPICVNLHACRFS